MDELIRDHAAKVVALFVVILSVVLGALYKLGWLKLKFTPKHPEKWDGHERRECVQHPAMAQKVCSLHTKMDEIDKKLDTVSERLQFVLGSIETRWSKKYIGD
jgi:uncharacterized membrane protein YagU involved in acid resistance